MSQWYTYELGTKLWFLYINRLVQVTKVLYALIMLLSNSGRQWLAILNQRSRNWWSLYRGMVISELNYYISETVYQLLSGRWLNSLAVQSFRFMTFTSNMEQKLMLMWHSAWKLHKLNDYGGLQKVTLLVFALLYIEYVDFWTEVLLYSCYDWSWLSIMTCFAHEDRRCCLLYISSASYELSVTEEIWQAILRGFTSKGQKVDVMLKELTSYILFLLH